MRDRTGRTIDYLRVSVTDRCNLRCRYCMPEEGMEPMAHGEILRLEEIRLICKVMAELGITKIKLTGGEPLVRKNVVWLVRELCALPGISDVTVTSNGILLPGAAAGLKQAGISTVNVSLDTLDAARFFHLTRHDCFDAVLRGIFAAQEVGLAVKINCAVTGEETVKEIKDFAEFSIRHHVPVRFIEMMPIGTGNEYESLDNHRLLAELKAWYGDVKPVSRTLGNGPAVYYEFANGSGTIGMISAVHHRFCHSCNRVRLTSDGFLKLCLAGDDGIFLRDKIREGCGEEELKACIRDAVLLKPEGHHFESRDCRETGMSRIGG